MSDPQHPTGIDSPESGALAYKVGVGICVVLFLADMVLSTHGHFAFEAFPGFELVYGFVSCVVLVLAAKQLRRLVKRDEDYYDG